MTKKEIIKAVLGTMSSIGAGAIAGAYIASAPYIKAFSPIMKSCVWLGGVALQGLVGDKASDYIDNTIDKIEETINTLKGGISDDKTEDQSV